MLAPESLDAAHHEAGLQRLTGGDVDQGVGKKSIFGPVALAEIGRVAKYPSKNVPAMLAMNVAQGHWPTR